MAFNPNALSDAEYWEMERRLRAAAPSREEQLAKAVQMNMARPRRSKKSTAQAVKPVTTVVPQVDPNGVLDGAISAISALDPTSNVAREFTSSESPQENLVSKIQNAVDFVRQIDNPNFLENMKMIDNAVSIYDTKMSPKAMAAIASDMPIQEAPWYADPINWISSSGIGKTLIEKLAGGMARKSALNDALARRVAANMERRNRRIEQSYLDRYGRMMP